MAGNICDHCKQWVEDHHGGDECRVNNLLATVERLTRERDELKKALGVVLVNDATKYQHHQARPSDGKKPHEVDGGSIFRTPREIAKAALEKLEGVKP